MANFLSRWYQVKRWQKFCTETFLEFEKKNILINNYWMRLSMISWIIETEVCYHRHEVFDNSWYHAKTEFNNGLLYIFHIIHPQKQKRSVQPFCFWGEHSKGLSNQADVELDMINAISAADIAFIMSRSSYCELNECSRPIRFFIVSLMYNNIIKVPMKWKIELLKKGLFERPLKVKKNGIFLFVISPLVPEIFKNFVLCKLGTDDVIPF